MEWSPCRKRTGRPADVPRARPEGTWRPTTITPSTARSYSSGTTSPTASSGSRSNRRFRDAILATANPSVVHEVIVTSPLGLIPRELERFHPARDYDIPVTGDWSRDEAAIVIEDLSAFLAANRYDAVVAHLGAEAPIVHEALSDALFSTKDHPTSEDSLVALTRTLDQVAS